MSNPTGPRSLFRSTLWLLPILLAGANVPAQSPASKPTTKPAPRPYLDAALAAERWLASVAQKNEDRTWWPVNPARPKQVTPNLYSGVAGVVLFYLELHAATGDKRHLETAQAGARYLVRDPGPKTGRGPAGLYTGLAGITFAVMKTARAADDAELKAALSTLLQMVEPLAKNDTSGVTDIIAGKAGVGLFQLLLDGDANRDHALAIGDALLKAAQPAVVGSKWRMSPRYARLMPNFSHGTAGVCYFLAALHEKTRQEKFLDAALAGAKYLEHISGKSCLAMHHEPGGEKLFYLGWCHGPTGTARLYYKLYQISKDKRWLDLVEAAGRAVMTSGIPEKRTPGFWNNVGVCCGNAGVADFFLDLHGVTTRPEYLAFAKRMTDDLLSRATRHEDGGLSWTHAEHRVRPKLLQAQTGYAQGAAGIGLLLLKLDAHGRRKVRIRLPDSPF